MGKPRLAAVILQYGKWQKTAECITALLQSSLMPEWIIIVDNASPDESASALEKWLRQHLPKPEELVTAMGAQTPPASFAVLLKQPHNGGYAAGNNAGIRLAMNFGADAVLLLNNDTRLAPAALAEMWRTLQTSPNAGLCGATIVYPQRHQPLQCCAGGHTNYITGLSTMVGEGRTLQQGPLPRAEVEPQLNFICGACVLASREFLEVTGLMDEGYFLYCEEQDWVLRARGRFSLVYAPGAVCYHQEGSTTGWNRRTCSWKQGFRLLKSRLRLACIHHPYYLPTVAVGCLFAAVRLLLRRTASALTQHTPSK